MIINTDDDESTEWLQISSFFSPFLSFCSQTARTTLMIKNIPNKYSQKMMLELLNKDFSETFDFFYLPIDFKNNCNLGYAFVNFKKAEDSLRFYRQYHMKKWIQFNSKKVYDVRLSVSVCLGGMSTMSLQSSSSSTLRSSPSLSFAGV